MSSTLTFPMTSSYNLGEIPNPARILLTSSGFITKIDSRSLTNLPSESQASLTSLTRSLSSSGSIDNSLSGPLSARLIEKYSVIAEDLNSSMTIQADTGTRVQLDGGVSISILEFDTSALDTKLFNNGDHNDEMSCSVSQSVMNMNGFEVLSFTGNIVPQLINSCLNETVKSLDSYDLLALHQASILLSQLFVLLLSSKIL